MCRTRTGRNRNTDADRDGDAGADPDDTVSNTYGTATGASGRVVGGENGRVFEVETTVTDTGGTVTYRYGHAAVGETEVERPAWADGS